LLTLSISILFLIYAIHSYFTYEFTINEAKKITLLRSEAQANNIVQDLDKYINSRISDLHDLTKIEQIKSAIIKSNGNLSNSDLKKLKSSLDTVNKDDHIPSFFNNMSGNKIPQELQNFILSYKNEYDYDVIKELSVTNQYGENIVLATGKSDYIQSDEGWWQITKDKQNYIGQIEFDKNYDDYVIPFAFPILDDSSNYLGTLRVVLSLRVLLHDFINDADVLQEAKKNVILLDENGNVIYQNGKLFPTSKKFEYFSKITTDNGSFEYSYPDAILISYASSIGYKDFVGFGWLVVIEQESSLIDELETLENNFLLSTLVGVVSAAILGIILSRFVTNPLGMLAKLTILLGRGEFDAKVQRSRITEINSIMNSFRVMETSLKKLFETEKNLAEANARIKNERLTAIGELAASMAHDMKNPLGTIRTGMDILNRHNEFDQDTNAIIKRMDRAVSRMSHQIEDVLNFVRKTPLLIKPVSIKSIIHSAIQSLDIPKTIQVDLGEQDIVVYCDEKKVEIVFINLILNSIQAIDKNAGKISIRIRQVGKNAVIQIEDSGTGIPEKVIPDIFKPLVTTKQKGTGLGLASCKNIVEQHGGSISFQNNPTIFTITMPIEQTR